MAGWELGDVLCPLHSTLMPFSQDISNHSAKKMKPRGKPFGGNRKFQRKGPPKPQAPAPIPEDEEISLLEQRIRDESPASGTQASRYL